uniref:Uncharacterized protein n=1 Tax=Arundo donax TaxID=35708 RepID=A0A0A9E227_ARUDO
MPRTLTIVAQIIMKPAQQKGKYKCLNNVYCRFHINCLLITTFFIMTHVQLLNPAQRDFPKTMKKDEFILHFTLPNHCNHPIMATEHDDLSCSLHFLLDCR